MAVSFRNRSFLKLLDFETEEIQYLLDLAAELKEAKKSGTENQPEPHIKITISKKNISSFIGTIPDTLSRILKKLQDEKIIRVSGKSIFISDMDKIKNLAR